VEPAVTIGSVSPYQTDEVKPEEPSFVQLTRLEPVEIDQQSGIGTGDYPDDPSQVRKIFNSCLMAIHGYLLLQCPEHISLY